TTFKCALCEASGLESFLNVESVVGDIGHELRMSLGLIETTHNAKPDADSVLLHESWNDRVQRPLAGLHPVGMILYEIKERATVLQHEPCSRRYQPGAKTHVVALNQRDDIAFRIDDTEIDGVLAFRICESFQVRRFDAAGCSLQIDELCSHGRVLLR